jgi:hypothetical protein
VTGRTCFEAAAAKGAGVFDTLKATMNAVVAQVRKQM